MEERTDQRALGDDQAQTLAALPQTAPQIESRFNPALSR